MSDHADDGFPRERYEGPMASAAKAENGNPDRYIKPAMGHGASGIENVTCGACGRPDRVLTAALADRDATIAEQAAEIQSLGETVVKLAADNDALEARLAALGYVVQLETDRDRERAKVAEQAAEIERLKQELFHATTLKRKLTEAEKEIAHMRESNGRADDYSAKLERVIEAANVNAGAMVNLLIAMANAGLPMPGPVPLTKEDLP